MSGDSNVRPIIIKRKKVVGGDGHHGGAWKVAYADFVTAMMAFFMLMWLLNATTEKQRKGIADYFSPTIALARVSGGGDGALGGDSVLTENTLPFNGKGATNLRPAPGTGANGHLVIADAVGKETGIPELEAVENLMMGRGGESMVADELYEHIVTKVTDEGLVVELYETKDMRLFEDDTKPTALLIELSKVLVEAASIVTNDIAVEGHTSAYPIVIKDNPSWDVSADRAVEFRKVLVESGLDSSRVRRVTSYADREPSRTNRMDIRNNRIEIVFLRNQ